MNKGDYFKLIQNLIFFCQRGMNFYCLRPGLSTSEFPDVMLHLRATVITIFEVCSKII